VYLLQAKRHPVRTGWRISSIKEYLLSIRILIIPSSAMSRTMVQKVIMFACVLNSDPGCFHFYDDLKNFLTHRKGDGVTDDTAAINLAISSGNRCGPGTCQSSKLTPAVVCVSSGSRHPMLTLPRCISLPERISFLRQSSTIITPRSLVMQTAHRR